MERTTRQRYKTLAVDPKTYVDLVHLADGGKLVPTIRQLCQKELAERAESKVDLHQLILERLDFLNQILLEIQDSIVRLGQEGRLSFVRTEKQLLKAGIAIGMTASGLEQVARQPGLKAEIERQAKIEFDRQWLDNPASAEEKSLLAALNGNE